MKEGWNVKKIGEIGKVCMCKRVMKHQTTPSGEIPFYKIGTFGKNPDAFITKAIYDEFKNKFSFPKQGDILISASGTIGRRVVYDGKPAYFQDSNIVWIDNDERKVINSYLYLFYGFCKWNPSKGATISRLYNADLRNIYISFPNSIEEQQAIVEKLDFAFEAVEKAKANIEKNIENAKELFQSKLNEIFSQKGEGWEEKKLNEISKNLDNRRIPITKNVRKPGEFRYYGASGIVDYVENFIFDGAYLLVSEDGANLLARTYPIAFSVDGKFWVNNHAHILEFKNFVTQRFVEYYLNSIKLDNYVTGMAQPKLSQSSLNKISVFIPNSNLKEQEKIVSQLDKLSFQTNLLQEKYKHKLANLEELKKSILEKAFKGELL